MALFSIPKCPSCIRPLVGGAFQQIRGKKKVAKITTVTVRLLKDVPKFGQAGMLSGGFGPRYEWPNSNRLEMQDLLFPSREGE